jgi:hypothetical protein
MSRDLSSTIVGHVSGTVVRPAFAAKLEFDTGNLNVWTGMGSLAFNPGTGIETFLGTGGLGGIAPVEETSTVRAVGMSFSLSGIPSSLLSLALLENYQDRLAHLWVLFFNADGSLLGSTLIFKGRMDTMDIEEGAEKSAITVTAESVLVGLEKANERRYTSEDQHLNYPSDKGFDFVPSLQLKEIKWQ